MNDRQVTKSFPAPLVSVVIPTCGRGPDLLGRAIDSALAIGSFGEIEVLVIPNGTSCAWEKSATRFKDNRHVSFRPISATGACAARNHGLRNAQGRYIRFLDDDDVLYPTGAKEQLSVIEKENADICSGTIEVFNPSRRLVRVWKQPTVDDFVVATLSPSRATLTHAHLYRTTSLLSDQWDEQLPIGQDFQWMLDLCSRRERNWVKVSTPVGAWLHHQGPRLFPGNHPGSAVTWRFAKMIELAVIEIEARGALTSERRTAAADGLWGCFQKGFVHSPRAWLDVADMADSLMPGRRPPSAIYRIPPFSKINPRLTEAVLSPVRITHSLLRFASTTMRRHFR